MTSQDTEALKALAQKWRITAMQSANAMNALCGGKGFSEKAASLSECAVELEAILERLLASQGAARELGLRWGRHDGRGQYHIEWHAPCGCAYHPEPQPHVHPCIRHAEIDPCHDK